MVIYGQVPPNSYVYCILDSVLQMYQENELWGTLRSGIPPEKFYEPWTRIDDSHQISLDIAHFIA